MKTIFTKLMIIILFSCFTTSLIVASESNSLKQFPIMPKNDTYTIQNYPMDGIHKKLGLSCTDCHSESKGEDYSNAMLKTCLQCHESYEKVKERTGHLGHNNNIHQSPHFEDLACDVCHKTHKPSQNLCVQCHGQQTMKKLIVK